MKAFCYNSILLTILIALFMISCGDKKSTDKTSSAATEAAEQSEGSETVNSEIEPWKAKTRLKPAENELESKIFEQLDSLDRADHEDRINLDAVKKLIELQKSFAQKYPDSKNSAKYLLAAADYSQGIREFDQALELLNMTISNFRGSYEAADALYYKGYLYDRQFKDWDNAVKTYNDFIKRYPNHDLLPTVQAHLSRIEAVKQQESQNK